MAVFLCSKNRVLEMHAKRSNIPSAESVAPTNTNRPRGGFFVPKIWHPFPIGVRMKIRLRLKTKQLILNFKFQVPTSWLIIVMGNISFNLIVHFSATFFN